MGVVTAVLDLLADQQLLLLFSVAAVGVLLGRVRVAGVRLGLAGVLFTGLLVAAVDERLLLDDLVLELGLALFVYAVGISSGPTFARALRGRGLPEAGAVLGTVGVAAVVTVGLGRVFGLSGPDLAGIVAGGLTNTPALAAAIDVAGSSDAGGAVTVAFATGYPLGIVIALVATSLVVRRVDPDATGSGGEPLHRRTARVIHATGRRLGDVVDEVGDVTAVRIRRERGEALVDPDEVLEAGDLVTLVGPRERVLSGIGALGEPGGDDLFLDRRALDFQRMAVSEPSLAGRRLEQLELRSRYGGMVTRVRRGDVEWLARDDTVIELGDRLLVVAPPDRLDDVAAYLGNSLRQVSELDVMTVGLGLALGLGLGLVTVPMPGGGTFSLGFAGGPIVVGLVLGALGRTGPLVWQIPYGANLTLRQLGSVLFLAAVGTRAGAGVVDALTDPASVERVAVTVAMALAAAGTGALLFGRVLGRDPARRAGLLAGALSQPAALALASDHTSDPQVTEGYATAFPLALIAQIVLAAILAAL